MLLKSFVLALLFWLPAAAQNSPEPHSVGSTVAAKQATEYTLPPDKLKKAEALYRLGLKFQIISPVYSWLVLLAVLAWGIAARYRTWAESVSRWRIVQALIFVPLLMITLRLASLPLSIYAHHIYLQYGLSVQKWGSWFADAGKGLGINIGIYILALWLLLNQIRKSPRWWWFQYWLMIVPIIILFMFLWPLVIDPLFDKFEPLEAKNPRLVEAIEKVTGRGGLEIPRSRMFEMKASEKVTSLNAYVTGFGASKRVVVWDTTIQKLSTPETLFVFGHEMGHYVLKHVFRGLIIAAIGLLIGFYLVYRTCGWVLTHFQQRWHIRELGDWAALPMLFVLLGIFSFIAEPITNTYSRHVEHQADIYGLEVTHGINPDSKEAAAHSFQVLGELSLDYPYPGKLAVFWFYNHPPTADRVRLSLDYDPWANGLAPKYVK